MTDDKLQIIVEAPLDLVVQGEVYVTEDELIEYLGHGTGGMRVKTNVLLETAIDRLDPAELTVKFQCSGKDYDAFRERQTLRYREKQYLPITPYERTLWQRIHKSNNTGEIIDALGMIYKNLYVYLEENPDCKGPRREDIDDNLTEIGATLYVHHNAAPWDFAALKQHLGRFSRYLWAFPVRQGY